VHFDVDCLSRALPFGIRVETTCDLCHSSLLSKKKKRRKIEKEKGKKGKKRNEKRKKGKKM